MNRLKVVLVKHNSINKWPAEKLDKNEFTVSRWCANDTQLSVETLAKIAESLDINIRGLLMFTKDNFNQ